MAISPLSLERCSAGIWRGRLGSHHQGLSRRDSRGSSERATARDEQAPSTRTPPHSIFGHAPGHRIAALPRGVLVDDEEIGESTGIIVMQYLSRRAEQALRNSPGDIIVSTRRSEGDPDGVPIGSLGE